MQRANGFRVALIDAPDARRQWDEFVRQAEDGSMSQCFWWADPLAAYGVTSHGIACWDGDTQVGGAMLRSIPVPLIKATITQCLQGPLFVEWRPEWAEAVIAGIEEVARRSNSISVTLEGCPRQDVVEDLAAAMGRAHWKVTRESGVREAILTFGGRSLTDLFARFHKGTRRAVRKGQQRFTEIRRVVGTDQLRMAHDTWLATAARKGFSDVRPWAAAEPMLRHSIDAGLGVVFASFAGEELVAAIFVTYIGATASYIYGGFLASAAQHRPNHVLHLEAIKVALERGCDAYNFGTLTRSPGEPMTGADQFKLGFGTSAVLRPDGVRWERKRAVYRVVQRLREHPGLETFVRRRLVGRG